MANHRGKQGSVVSWAMVGYLLVFVVGVLLGMWLG